MPNLQGTIFKKCDMANHRPASNKGCAAGTCQHTCANPDRCQHAWTLRYSVAGKQTEQSFKDDMTADKRVRFGTGLRKAQDAQLELTRGKRAEGQTYVTPSAGRDNFGDACTAFIIGMRCTDSTRTSYRTVLSKWVAPVMGHMTVAKAADSHKVVEDLMTSMGHLSSQRRRVARLLITGVLDKAIRQSKISGHKITDIDVGEDVRVRHDEFIFPNFSQVAYLAENMGIMIWLMRGCGLRIEEALAVSKSDFRNGGKTLRVSGQASRDGRRKMPLKHRKEGEYRDVPVPAWLWAMVKDMDGNLCPGNGRPYMVYGTVQAQMYKFAPRAGIPAGFTCHSLRHVYASMMLGEGVQITDLAKWLGHRSINVTYDTYGHLLPHAEDQAITVLDREFERWQAA